MRQLRRRRHGVSIPPEEYPETLPNLIMWIDGRLPAYMDTAATAQASSFAGRVRRTDYHSPLVGRAQAPNDSQRPWRENSAFNFEIGANTQLNAPASADCLQSAVTIAFAFSMRDKPAGAPQNLIGNGALKLWTFSDNVVDVNYNSSGSNWFIGPSSGGEPYARTPLGHRVEVVLVTYANLLKATVVVNGTRTEYTLPTTVVPTTLSASGWLIGSDGTGVTNDQLAHMAFSQALVIGRSCTSTEVSGLLAFMRANPAPGFCPPQVPLLTVSGDSIAAGSAGIFGVPVAQRWSSVAQQLLNATQPVNVINAAISGDTIVHQRDVTYPTVLAPFYDAGRAKAIAALAAGTNDIANAGRTGPVVLADQYAFADAVLAAGVKPAVCTILPRNPGGGFDVANFNTQSGYYNTHLRAEAAGRGYLLIDFAAIPQAADPTNLTYYSDGIHPTVALQTLMASVAATALQAWLSAP